MPDQLLRPRPGYSSLRRHRWSAPGAEYFVTFKAERAAEGLSNPELLTALTQQRQLLETQACWTVRTWSVMPDHVHIVFTLGPSLEISECLRKFKGPLTPLLRHYQLRWQPGYYEHRMRHNEDRLPVFLYVFLNPHRKKLIRTDEKWPGYYCAEEDWIWFGPLTNEETPFPEWLA
jgi:putative transposase